MKRMLIVLFFALFTPLLAGIYGIIHDQITYTLSSEYFNHFRFIQFGFVDLGADVNFEHPRWEVAKVGFLATWWVGIPIGVVLGLLGLIHKRDDRMFWVTFRAIGIALLIAMITGLIGLLYGELFVDLYSISFYLPQDLEDPETYHAVSTMHNMGYLGGSLGLIGGALYSIRQELKQRR